MYHSGQFLAVPMLDHLIISETQYLSFVEEGYLAKIAKSKKYVLQFKKEEERLRKEGALNKAIEMAKIMKKDGRTIEEIMRYTRLSRRKIVEL